MSEIKAIVIYTKWNTGSLKYKSFSSEDDAQDFLEECEDRAIIITGNDLDIDFN